MVSVETLREMTALDESKGSVNCGGMDTERANNGEEEENKEAKKSHCREDNDDMWLTHSGRNARPPCEYSGVCTGPLEGAVDRKVKKKKKKPTIGGEADLREFIVDNKLREEAGLKKIRRQAVPHLNDEANEENKEKPEHKGVRKDKKATKTKKQILNTREHCDALALLQTDEAIRLSPLDELVIDFLKRLKKQIDAIHKTNPTKARAKRNFVCGLHESLKHIRADNVKCVFVARNLDEEITAGPSLFHSVREECLNRSIPIVHASTKRLLSRAVQRFPYTNIVAVFGFQGFEDLYRSIIELWASDVSHTLYHIDQTSLFP